MIAMQYEKGQADLCFEIQNLNRILGNYNITRLRGILKTFLVILGCLQGYCAIPPEGQ